MSDRPDLYWALAYIRLHQNEDLKTQALALCDEIATRVTEARLQGRAEALKQAAEACDRSCECGSYEDVVALASSYQPESGR
jgi:hypothetical protein